MDYAGNVPEKPQESESSGVLQRTTPGAGEDVAPRPLPTADEVRATRAATRRVADDLLRLAAAGVRDDLQHPGEVAAAWLLEYPSRNTRQAYARDLAAFFVYCAQRPIHVFEVKRSNLAQYLAQPKPDGAAFAPKTQERRLAAISGFYTYALELDLIARHPRGHRKPLSVKVNAAGRAAALSKHEFERLTHTAREHSPTAQAAVLLLGLYGLRVSELCALQIEQLAWDHGQPVLRIAGKGRATNETVNFPVPPDVQRILEQSAADRTTGPLLLKSTGKPYVRQEVAALLATLTSRAKIPTRLTPHGLRATFITLALNEGVALRDVQDAARHADPRTTRTYDRDAGALNRHPVHRLVGIADTTET